MTSARSCHRRDPGGGAPALGDNRYSPAAKRANLVWDEAAPHVHCRLPRDRRIGDEGDLSRHHARNGAGGFGRRRRNPSARQGIWRLHAAPAAAGTQDPIQTFRSGACLGCVLAAVHRPLRLSFPAMPQGRMAGWLLRGEQPMRARLPQALPPLGRPIGELDGLVKLTGYSPPFPAGARRLGWPRTGPREQNQANEERE